LCDWRRQHNIVLVFQLHHLHLLLQKMLMIQKMMLS